MAGTLAILDKCSPRYKMPKQVEREYYTGHGLPFVAA
jgi:hypothetical protein